MLHFLILWLITPNPPLLGKSKDGVTRAIQWGRDSSVTQFVLLFRVDRSVDGLVKEKDKDKESKKKDKKKGFF